MQLRFLSVHIHIHIHVHPSAVITQGNLREQFCDNCNWSSMAFNWSEQVAHKLSAWKCGQSQLRVNDDRNGESCFDILDLDLALG